MQLYQTGDDITLLLLWQGLEAQEANIPTDQMKNHLLQKLLQHCFFTTSQLSWSSWRRV